jgi:DNA-binding transcriptional MerR regulator
MVDDQEPEYMTVEKAAQILKVTPRMVNRYGNMNPPRLRWRKAGRRILYHPRDVEQLAADLDVANKPAPAATVEMTVFEPSEVLKYLRERDRQLAEVQVRLEQALIDLGRAQGLIERYHVIETERDTLRKQLEDLQHGPWWKRLLRRR